MFGCCYCEIIFKNKVISLIIFKNSINQIEFTIFFLQNKKIIFLRSIYPKKIYGFLIFEKLF